jgi:hypothetical protein
MKIKYKIGQRVFALDVNQKDEPLAIYIAIVDSITITEDGVEYWLKHILPPYTEWGDSISGDNISIHISQLAKRLKL